MRTPRSQPEHNRERFEDVIGMDLESYGEHAEVAARALGELIGLDVIPTSPQAADRLLQCRDAVIGALRQRLFDLGFRVWTGTGSLPPPAPGIDLEGVDYKLGSLLDAVAGTVPVLLPDARRSPLEVLGAPADHPVVETWRRAAVELLAATHTLATASDKPWLRDPGAGWWVLRDTAVALEAVLVLDQRLREVGLLNTLDRRPYPLGLEEQRLIVSQAARVATWYATSNAADHAIPRTPSPTPRQAKEGAVRHPVVLVSTAADLAAAQQRLSTYLQPINAQNAFFIGEPEITADSARHLSASQLNLCRTYAQVALRSRKTASFAPFFAERAEVLAELRHRLRHLVDVKRHEPNQRQLHQQSEITTAVSRMATQGVRLALPPDQLADLAQATHEATHNLGVTLRRELLRPSSNLRVAAPRLEDAPTLVRRRSRLASTCTDLINLPAPTIPADRYSTPFQRAMLRETLDLTPTAARPPSPFPYAPYVSPHRRRAARNDGLGDPAPPHPAR